KFRSARQVASDGMTESHALTLLFVPKFFTNRSERNLFHPFIIEWKLRQEWNRTCIRRYRTSARRPPMSEKPSEAAIQKMRKFVEKYCEKSGTTTHPDHEVTEVVILGLASHHETLGKPLCPCRFYPDKNEEIKHRTWICACDDMQIYKYCHCLLFVNS